MKCNDTTKRAKILWVTLSSGGATPPASAYGSSVFNTKYRNEKDNGIFFRSLTEYKKEKDNGIIFLLLEFSAPSR